MAETIEKTAGFADSIDMGLVDRIHNHATGEVVGYLSTLLKNQYLRKLYEEVLETPIMTFDKPEEAKLVESTNLNWHGGYGSFRGRPMIFVNPGISRTAIVKTILEEGAHALRKAKGRQLSQFDFTNPPKEEEYLSDPEEVSAKNMAEYAFGIAEGKIKTAAKEFHPLPDKDLWISPTKEIILGDDEEHETVVTRLGLPEEWLNNGRITNGLDAINEARNAGWMRVKVTPQEVAIDVNPEVPRMRRRLEELVIRGGPDRKYYFRFSEGVKGQSLGLTQEEAFRFIRQRVKTAEAVSSEVLEGFWSLKWAIWDDRVIFDQTQDPHADWFHRLGIPSHGKAFDKIPRGRLTVRPKDKEAVIITDAGAGFSLVGKLDFDFDAQSFIAAVKKKFPKLRSYEFRDEVSPEIYGTGVYATASKTAERLDSDVASGNWSLKWAIWGDRVYFDQDTIPHADWFRELHIPDSGEAFDRVPRGRIRVNPNTRIAYVFTDASAEDDEFYDDLVGRASFAFAPQEVIEAAKKKFPQIRGYEFLDDVSDKLVPKTAASSAYRREVKLLAYDMELEDATSNTGLERVVWERKPVVMIHTLSQLGVGNGKSYPHVRALHVSGDTDFWFSRLVEDYGRDSKAWVMEILPVEGDYLADDPSYTIPDESGNKADSYLLITSRTRLREGIDFKYTKELTAEDLPEEPAYQEDDSYKLGTAVPKTAFILSAGAGEDDQGIECIQNEEV